MTIGDPEDTDLYCAECNKTFTNRGAKMFHDKNKHTGADAGVCPTCHKAFRKLSIHKCKVVAPELPVDDRPDFGPELIGDDADPERAPMTPPGALSMTAEPKRKLRERVRSKLWGEDKAGAKAGDGNVYATVERKPTRKAGGRESAATILGMAWGGIGAALVKSNADVPVGRVMQIQSDAAGDILDRLIAKTWVDRFLQPFASRTEDLEALAALVMLPTLVGVMERSPDAAPTLEPLLRMAIQSNLTAMAPVVKRRKAEAKKFAEALAELDLADIGPPGSDPVDSIIATIFAPPPGFEPPAAAPASNGAHAGTPVA